MSKYIDADALKESWKKIEVNGATLSVIYGLFKSVDNAPLIEIVRCEECEYYVFKQKNKSYEHSRRYCNNGTIKATKADDFCSRGKRRSDE